MPKNEKAKNTKTQESEKTPTSTSSNSKFRSPYTALVSALKRKLDNKEYAKEMAIIKRLIALGYDRQTILAAYNLYTNNYGRKIDSFAFLLYNKGIRIKDVLHLLVAPEQKEEIKIEGNEDFRTAPRPVHKMTLAEFLNNTEKTDEDQKNMDKK